MVVKSTQSLLFRKPCIVCAESHRHHGFHKKENFDFAKESVVAPLGFNEIPLAAKHYPILFLENDGIIPVAIMGLSGKMNAFVQADGHWLPGHYIPQIFQLYPFTLEKLPDQDNGVLIVDMDCGAIISNADQYKELRLFDSEGSPTHLLREIASAAQKRYYEGVIGAEFASLLRDSNVLTQSLVQFEGPTGPNANIARLLVINEPAYRSLPVETIAGWFRSGWLDVASVVLLSQKIWSQWALPANTAPQQTRRG